MRNNVSSHKLILALILVAAFTAAVPVTPRAYEPSIHWYMCNEAMKLYPLHEPMYRANVFAGSIHEDEYDHVYGYTEGSTDSPDLTQVPTVTHFWDADKGELRHVKGKFPNAWMKAAAMLRMAINEYNEGGTQKKNAYDLIGHICHLIGDMSVPAHVHEDYHPTSDTYEDDMNDYYDEDRFALWWNASKARNDAFSNSLLPDFSMPQAAREKIRDHVLPGYAKEYPEMEIFPDDYGEPYNTLYYVMYTTNQVADWFPSEDELGDEYERHGWVSYDNFPHYNSNTWYTAERTFIYSISAVAAFCKAWSNYTQSGSTTPPDRTGRTIRVPGNYPTIQQGIDAAIDGDTVLVADETYTNVGDVNLDFRGKAITVRSESGNPETCIIDCGNRPGIRGFYFHSGEGPNSILKGFTIQGGNTDTGGGILCRGSSPTIDSTVISSNMASGNGGGIACYNGSCPRIVSSIVRENTAGVHGGGISCYAHSLLTITKTDISLNRANQNGGGIHCWVNSSPTMTSVIIGSNEAKNHGGGIFCYDNSCPNITTTIIEANRATIHNGGGIYCAYNSSPTLTSDTIVCKNTAGEYGGGIFCYSYSMATITQTAIFENTANNNGGGVYCAIDSPPTIDKTIIKWNKAKVYNGGGIFCHHYSEPTITNTLICKNTAKVYGGAIFYSDHSAPLIINATIADNSALKGGAGIQAQEKECGKATITNTILWNRIGGGVKEINYWESPIVTYSDVQGGWEGTGNINKNPVFVNAPGCDYHLSNSSPCIGRGTRNPDVPPTDIEGIPRPLSAPDMGAYEHQWKWKPAGLAMDDTPSPPEGYDNEIIIEITISNEDDDTPSPPEGYDNVFSMALSPGLNMISVPLEPIVPLTARSLSEEIRATVVINYDAIAGKFVGFAPAASDDGFPIEGGRGYIVNVPGGGTVTFTGAAWTNESPVEMQEAPAIAPNTDAWAFLVSGSVLEGDLMSASDGNYTAVVKSLRTGEIFTEAVDTSGYFAAAWADLSRKAVIGAGDKIEVAVVDSSGSVVSGPFIHDITLDAIRNAVVNVHLKLGDIIPAESALLQNYPNPLNPETWIPYHLKEDASVMIRIYSSTGQLVRTLNLGHKPAGYYTAKEKAAYWDGRNEAGELIASGIYFYSVQAGDYTAVKKMAIVR